MAGVEGSNTDATVTPTSASGPSLGLGLLPSGQSDQGDLSTLSPSIVEDPATAAADNNSVLGDGEEDEEVDQLEEDDELASATGTASRRAATAAATSFGRDYVRGSSSTKDKAEVFSRIEYTDEEMAAFRVDETIPGDINPGSANLYSNAVGEKLFRNTPIKKNDGGTILRSDLQHSLLLEIFDDTTRCFRNPRPAPEGSWTYPPKPGEAAATGVYEYSPMYPHGQSNGSARRSNETPEEYAAWKKKYDKFWSNPYPTPEEDPERTVPRPGDKILTFKELYMEALMNSPRCTKAVRDKIWQDEEYAQDFLCVNLLINIGRMNTTLAFFAQMQTILRCYHPLPSLQRCENSRKHMQDAPRMKSLLKSVLLPFEKASTGPGSAPASKAAQAANVEVAIPEAEQIELAGSLEEVIQRYRDGRVPSTSVVNLIFLFQIEAPQLSTMHFTQPHDMFSIFFPHKDYPIPAKQRAKAFLWLVWHYLEGGAVLPPGNDKAVQNPFVDEQAAASFASARSKWDTLDESNRKLCTLGGRGLLWQGVRNMAVPERTYIANTPANDAASKADANAGTGTGANQALSGASFPSPEPGLAGIPENEARESYTHRILAPGLTATTLEEVQKENIDLSVEIEWGRTQAHERRVFMVRAALEEKEKAEAEARGEPIPAHLGGKGKGKGKRRSRGGANAIATASAAAGEARLKLLHKRNEKKRKLEEEEETGAGGSGGRSRRIFSRSPNFGMDGELPESLAEEDEDEDDLGDDAPSATGGFHPPRGSQRASTLLLNGHLATRQKVGSGTDPTATTATTTTMPAFRRPLVESDLTLFPVGGSPTSSTGSNNEMETTQTSVLLPPLSRMAWNRILQRAVRGQGDACYDSDEEEAAIDESERCGLMFGSELARVLGCVWSEGKRVGIRGKAIGLVAHSDRGEDGHDDEDDEEEEDGEEEEEGEGGGGEKTVARRRVIFDPYSLDKSVVGQIILQ